MQRLGKKKRRGERREEKIENGAYLSRKRGEHWVIAGKDLKIEDLGHIRAQDQDQDRPTREQN